MPGREFATEKIWEELRDIERHYVRQWTHPTDDARLNAIVRAEWEQYLLPALRDQAIQSRSTNIQYAATLSAAWPLATGLFDALHVKAYVPGKGEEARYFWRHQEFDLFRTNDFTRGFAIDKAELLGCAATYLSQPDIRICRFDWLFLDAIVFAELDAYGFHVFNSRGGTGANWAAIFSNRNPVRYYGLSIVFWILGVLFSIVAPLSFVYYLGTSDHDTAALVVGGIWALLFVWTVVTYPIRWRARRKSGKLLQHLIDLYRLLGDETISPRNLKGTLDTATAAGVVLDGAVFTIVDRLLARDPTGFIPNRMG